MSELEGKWSQIVDKIIASEKIDITDEEFGFIVLLFFVFDIRTKSSSSNILELLNKISKDIEEDSMDVPEELLKINNSKDINKIMIELSIISILLTDLKLILIKNSTKRDFVTSDSMTVKYNQLTLETNANIEYGYSSNGLQMFLPVSSKICLCLYDNTTYTIKGLKNNILELKGVDEILKFNKLFLYNSYNYLIFNNNSDKNTILKQLSKTKERYNFRTEVFESKENHEKIYKIE